MVDYDAEMARMQKMLDEVEVESSFDEDEIENVFQFDSEGEEDNVEVNKYYPDCVLKSFVLNSHMGHLLCIISINLVTQMSKCLIVFVNIS